MMLLPQRVVSLWEMIEIVDKGNLVASVSAIGALCKYLQMAQRECIEAKRPGIVIDQAQADVMIQGTAFLREIAEELGMISASAAGGDVRTLIAQIPGSKSNGYELELVLIGQLIGALEYQIRAFRDEMEVRSLFVMNPAHVAFYSPNSPLFGPDVDRAFPSAAGEISESGKCRATGRWTACVLHLMRALEPALLAFQRSLNVISPKINWQDIINQVEAAIKANGHKHPDHQWNSEASLQFLKIKDAWRNYAAHGKERYDEERAVTIYNSVRAFMMHLAARLAE